MKITRSMDDIAVRLVDQFMEDVNKAIISRTATTITDADVEKINKLIQQLQYQAKVAEVTILIHFPFRVELFDGDHVLLINSDLSWEVISRKEDCNNQLK